LKRIVDVKLDTTADEFAILKQTLKAANEACRTMSEWAWTHQKFTHHALHQACYADACASGLSAHFAERCLARVLDAYAHDRSRAAVFEPDGPVIFHDSYLRFDLAKGWAHIAATGGRLKLPFDCDPADYPLLESWRGDCELVLREAGFHLIIPCDEEDEDDCSRYSVLGWQGEGRRPGAERPAPPSLILPASRNPHSRSRARASLA
jgi:hypothetical protein